MSRAGSSSDPPDAGPGYKKLQPPLCLIIGRCGPPLPDVTDDAADNTDECMTHAEAGKNEKDGDSHAGDDGNRKNDKKKDPPL